MKKVLLITGILALFYLNNVQAQFKINKNSIGAGVTAAKAVTISDAEVIEMSTEYANWMDTHNPVAGDDTEYGKRLKKLTEKHQNESGFKLNFKAYEVIDVNAFALADGSVRVCAGLMDIMTDEEILGVIGHEIGHVKNSDAKDAIRTAYLASAAKQAASSQSGTVAALSDSQLGELAEALANAQFSQKQETDADNFGYEFLKKNGYHVEAMASAFRKLAALEKEAGAKGKSKMFSTHPDSEKRAQKMEERAKSEEK